MIKKYNKSITEDIDELLMVLVYLGTLRDMDSFISDLLTDKELYVASMRWKAVRMLSVDISYTKIAKVTGMSSATIARLSKLLNKRGSGFKNILSNMR
jgi:uncharacterized protein YerC